MENNDNKQLDESVEKEAESFGEEDFGKLLEESSLHTGRLEPGQKVQGVVSKIGEDWIFIDFGGKSEGCLDKKELLDENGELPVKEGDEIQTFFLSDTNGEVVFTTKIASGDAGREHLEDAWRSGIPVEGSVEKEIKGWFEVRVGGSVRAFCPFSQMALQRVENPADYVGKRFSFKITELGEKGRNVVLSHRAVLEEERREQREALRETLKEGMTVQGTVTSLRDFGAFVRVDCIEGLLPISEISWSRVDNIGDILTVGQDVEVIVLKLDWDKERYSFSLKGTLPNPWDDVESKYPQGSRCKGVVARLTNFGAFVTLEPGVDGLVHISKMGGGKRIKHPQDVVQPGQQVEVKVESVDKGGKRLSLALVVEGAGKGRGAHDDEGENGRDYKKYIEEPPRAMGTFGDLLKSKLSEKNKK